MARTLRSPPATFVTTCHHAAPVKVIGDLHGQFGDLMHLFRVYGTPSRLGDINVLDYLVSPLECGEVQ